MPIVFYFNKHEKLMVSRYSGIINDGHFVNSYKMVFENPNFELGFDELVDLTGLDSLKLTFDGIDQVQNLVCEKRTDSTTDFKTAIVYETGVQFGFARMYKLYNPDKSCEDVMVFKTKPEALRWLNRDPDLIKEYDTWEKLIT